MRQIILTSINANAVFPEILLAFQFFVRKFWGNGPFFYKDGSRFNACFIPKPGINETLQQACTAFYDKALYVSVVEVIKYLFNAFLRVYNSWRASVQEA